MSREDFVAIGARIFAIYLLISTIKEVPGALQLLSQEYNVGWAVFYGLVLSLGLLASAFLWFFPLTVARKLLPVMREPRSEQAMDASIGMSVGLTLIGAWVMAYALADAIYWLTLWVRTRQLGATYFAWSHEHVAGMVATGVQILIAIWLIFGSAGIRRLIYRYRYGASADAT